MDFQLSQIKTPKNIHFYLVRFLMVNLHLLNLGLKRVYLCILYLRLKGLIKFEPWSLKQALQVGPFITLSQERNQEGGWGPRPPDGIWEGSEGGQSIIAGEGKTLDEKMGKKWLESNLRKEVTYFSSYLLFKEIVWWTLAFDMKKILVTPLYFANIFTGCRLQNQWETFLNPSMLYFFM